VARTEGHGNPDWGRDETILALDLYFQAGSRALPEEDERVHNLSNILRSLPYHAQAVRKPSFRNAAGVAFKLLNLRNVATGKGLKNVSETDREVWRLFGSSPQDAAEAARLIYASVDQIAGSTESDESEEFIEGRAVTRAHLSRERSKRVRNRLLAARRKRGILKCDLCGWRPTHPDNRFSDAYFEAHHLVPLACAGSRITRLSEVALLCANCHRLIHRAIALEKRWVGLDEARTFSL
jgi:5-methylcytosine-specific restriction enzyme A